LRDDSSLEKALRAIPVETGTLKVGLRPCEVRLRGIQVGFGGDGIGARRFQRLLGGGDIGGRLHVFELRQQLALPDPITFMDIKVSDLSERIGPDVDVSLRLDLARGGHDGRKILALRPTRLDRDYALVGLMDAY